MNIIIDNKSGKPIYEQIYTQLKEQIIGGNLEADAPLPSIRSLAKDLRISVITTKHAYDELEKEGFIYMVAAKGCYVAAMNLELIKEQNLQKIEEHLQEAVRLAEISGVEKAYVEEMLQLVYEENP